ncbi:MAG: helix-turn-helix domain-containing protein [Halioglobus sp.]|nr:helix-turn-helix domain-containing protein [Halioglobus sp.]
MPQANPQISTRELLLDAAEHLFATRGYQSTTIKQVAEQVGVQGPAIYKHFDGKRDLFEQVLERLFTPFLDLLADGAAAGGDQGAIMRQHLSNPNASRIVQHATLSGGEDLALLVERWYRPFFREVPKDADAAPSGFTPVSVMAFHSMLLGYLTLAPLHEAIFATDPLGEDALAELLQLQQRLAAAVANTKSRPD